MGNSMFSVNKTTLNKTIKLSLVVLSFSLILSAVFFVTDTRADTDVIAVTDVIRRSYLPLLMRAKDPIDFENPSFEDGMNYWTYYSTQGGFDIHTSAQHFDGWYSARLGSDTENYRMAWIAQQVVVPDGRPWLTYWYYVDTPEDYCPSYTLYDFIRLKVNNYEIVSFPLCDDESHPNRVWLKQAIDLSVYQSMNVQVKVYFENDGSLPSDIYVDLFSFQSSP